MLVDNGRPHLGVVAYLRFKTKAKYHHVCKMLLKMDAQMKCDKMAEVIKKKYPGFRKQSKHFQSRRATKVDDADSMEEICDLFVDKFFKICILLCLTTMLTWKC